MKKLIVLGIVCLFLTTGMSFGKSLVLTLSNNDLVYYLLGGEKNPTMHFIDGKIVLNTDEYAFNNIKNFYISDTDEPTSIESLLKEQQISYKDGTFILHTDKSASIGVYTTNGIKVDAAIEHINGIVAIHLGALPKDIYIIRMGESSFKVTKK